MADGKSMALSLDEIRARLDEIDAQILPLIDERTALARAVAVAKAAEGGPPRLGLRAGREAQLIRRLLSKPREAATPTLVVRIWRELIGASLAAQGPYNVTVWGGSDAARTVELARARFGASAALAQAARPDDALAKARTLGGIAVCALAPPNAWWGRLLAEPSLKVFALLPCLATWGGPAALAVAAVDVEPTGSDQTFWVTDAGQGARAIIEALGRDGVAADLLTEAGGLKLFALAGYYQADDPRLARAPGQLTGVIGAAPMPLDV